MRGRGGRKKFHAELMGDGWWKYFDFISKLNLEQTHTYLLTYLLDRGLQKNNFKASHDGWHTEKSLRHFNGVNFK